MAYNEDMNIFNVCYDNDSIRLETNHSEFTSFEKIMMIGAKFFIDQGKTRDLQQIIINLQTKVLEAS
jgi:hypothetical protein